MTKADLIEEVFRAVEMTRKDSELIVDTIFESIVQALTKLRDERTVLVQLWIGCEQAAVVRRHVPGTVTGVDDAPDLSEVVPERRRLLVEDLVGIVDEILTKPPVTGDDKEKD